MNILDVTSHTFLLKAYDQAFIKASTSDLEEFKKFITEFHNACNNCTYNYSDMNYYLQINLLQNIFKNSKVARSLRMSIPMEITSHLYMFYAEFINKYGTPDDKATIQDSYRRFLVIPR